MKCCLKIPKNRYFRGPIIINSEYMGKLSLRYFGPIVWETMLPDSYKEISELEKFKEDIKKWVPDCKCRLCKTYVRGLGFTETFE